MLTKKKKHIFTIFELFRQMKETLRKANRDYPKGYGRTFAFSSNMMSLSTCRETCSADLCH